MKSNFKICDMKLGDINEISASHNLDGEDVTIRHIADIAAPGPTNGLLVHVRELLESHAVDKDTTITYEPQEVAVLFDGPKVSENLDSCHAIFSKHYPESRPQKLSEASFPVRGVLFSTVDNFMGLDSNVCRVS